MKRITFSILFGYLPLLAVTAGAQSFQAGDVVWPESADFAKNVSKWQKDHKISEDDNFFISRVRPRLRFRNAATQVNPQLKEGINDKRLCAWLPINVIKSDAKRNSLPTGEFDSECFTMWSYVDHWGNWSAPLGAIPGNFTDVAHKNGVTVSSLASIPFGVINSQWSKTLDEISELKAEEVAPMLVYYGADGIGYNSEFSGYKAAKLAKIRELHQGLVQNINALYAKVTPGYDMAENMWYDGTSADGEILFDRGLASHNAANWGAKGEERTSLFFNYNWNNTDLLQRTVANAQTLAGGRSPLYLYCGINLQGGEPRMTKPTWSVMKDFPVSIGLWGAHSENMFWQSRTDKGQSPAMRQQTYQSRLEQWFSGGRHNPADLPGISVATRCETDDATFHGMATFMSARSALRWDLGEAPFISCFNVGNGRFFNWRGERANDNEWYNIGIQDYMPTWRWWITADLLGRDASQAVTGVTPAFTWDDAWLGGSCLRITGSASQAFIHLFKTSFELDGTETLSVRYKTSAVPEGVALVGTLVGSEGKVAFRLPLSDADEPDSNGWHKAEVSLAGVPADSELALLALEFKNADGIDLKIGEISLSRNAVASPVMPEITSAKALRNTYSGIDGKIIFNVPNTKPAAEVCYNDDVNIAMFKIYSQEEGGQPSLRGATTSWAALSYATPFTGNEDGVGKIRFGVSAVGLDLEEETPIAWSEWIESGERIFSDDITSDKFTITPGESFTLRAVDPKRKFDWIITESGRVDSEIASSDGYLNEWTVEGIDRMGSYDLYVSTPESGEPTVYRGYVSVTDPARGRVPEIESLAANGEQAEIHIVGNDDVSLSYTGREADGTRSRGLKIDENSFGVRLGDVLETGDQSFSIAGWMKVENYPGAINWIDVARRDGEWPRNNWGWLWCSLNPDGTIQNYDQDYSPADKGATTRCVRYAFGEPGERIFNKNQWNHFAMVFDRDRNGTRTLLYINGQLLESTWGYYYSSDYAERETLKASGTTHDIIPAFKDIDLENYVIIGGTRRPGRGHGGLGFTGVLDDIEIWNRAMTEEEVKTSYAGHDAGNLPEGIAAFFDFESAPDQELMLEAKGSHPQAKGGYFQLRNSAGAEGQSTYDFLPPAFTSGSPFIAGKNYKIVTTPEWSVPSGMIKQSGGTDTHGSATVTFPTDGEHSASLTLTNDLGSDTKTYSCIHVTSAGIDEALDGSLHEVNVSGREVLLTTDEPGDFHIALHDLQGQLLLSRTLTIDAAGQHLLLTLPAKGIYLLNLNRGGARQTGYKLICH